MRLRLLAPFRSHFQLSLGYTLKTGRLSAFSQDYLDFWNELQTSIAGRDLVAGADINFMHSARHLGEDTVRYSTIDTDSLRYNAEMIVIRPTESGEIADLYSEELSRTVDTLSQRRVGGKKVWDKLANKVSLIPQSTVVRIFDNNISLFETELDVTDILVGVEQSGIDKALDEVREFAVFCGEALINHYYATHVFPLLQAIAEELDADHVFTDPLYAQAHTLQNGHGLEEFEYPLTSPYERGHCPSTEVLWVTRSLICDRDDGNHMDSGRGLDLPSIVKTWLRSVGDGEQAEKVANDADNYSTQWLNYLFREKFVVKNDGREFKDVWGAMQLCQYYYSAVEGLNDGLNRVLSLANQDKASGRLQELHTHLDNIVRRCELVLASYNEMQKYLSRDKYNAFREILGYWNFNAMEAQVREKMAVCRSRLESLSRKSSEKGRLYTDILLAFVSLFILLDMSITLALFGRSPTDTVYAQDANYSGFILAWVARLQPHAIIIAALIAVALLGLIIYILRRRRMLYE